MLVCQALLSKVGAHAKQSFSGRHYQAELGSELNGEQLEATSGHPFYIQGKGWNAAANLKVGDALLLYNGTTVVVATVDFRVGREQVYNFSVAQNANYFVGLGGVVVHNAKKCAYQSKPVAKRYRYNSEKEAYESAKRAGNGNEPIKHSRSKHGPHYHPGDGKGQPLNHDHYYFPKHKGSPVGTGPREG